MQPQPRPRGHLAFFLIALAAVAIPWWATGGEANLPHSFSNGGVIRASEFNANFSALRSAINDNHRRLASAESSLANLQLKQGPQGPTGPAGILSAHSGGRLTLDNTEPTPGADLSNQTTLYFLPFRSDRIALWVGGQWTLRSLGSGLNVSNAGLAVDTNYDVFVHGSSPALELSAWASGSARQAGAGVTRHQGVWTKEGDPTRRYVGTVRTVDDGGVAKFEDSSSRRFVWNADNRVRGGSHQREVSATWVSTNTAYAPANSGFAGYRHDFVRGLDEDPVEASVRIYVVPNSVNAFIGFGLNSGTTLAGGSTEEVQTVNGTIRADFVGRPAVGHSYLQVITRGDSTNTNTWHGNPQMRLIVIRSY